jgi:hypothetical protein
LCHAGKIVTDLLHQLHAEFLMRHFPAPKLQLYPNFISSIEEFFTVTNFRQIIVIVDVNPEFKFFQLRARRSSVPLVFGDIVSEFSERNDFANRRICRRRNLDQIETETLSFAQGIRQLHDAELFAAGA